MSAMEEGVSRNPLVSVVIPAYENPDYLNQAVRSVCGQTWANHELIVVDDGSTDECVAQYELPKTACLIRHESNRGAAAAMNTGVSACAGEYVAFLDQDDVWLPGKLEAQVAKMQADPDASLAYCRCDTVDDELAPRPNSRWDEKPPSPDPLRQLLEGCFVRSSSAIMVRRQALSDVGEFDESLPGAYDYDFYIRLALRYEFVYNPEPLVLYRMHSGQFTRRLAEMNWCRVRVAAKALPAISQHRPDLIRPARRFLSRCQMLHAHTLMHHKQAPSAAARALLDGLAAWPGNVDIYARLAWLPFAALRCAVLRSLDSRRVGG